MEIMWAFFHKECVMKGKNKNNDEFLNKNVKFWVVAKAGDYSFYDNSIAVVSSSYLIGEDGSPSMAEGN